MFPHIFHKTHHRALPPGVELSVAESVRFTGCAVRVLTSPRGAYAGRALFPESEVQEAAAAVGRLSAAPAFDPAVFASVIERLRSRAVRGDSSTCCFFDRLPFCYCLSAPGARRFQSLCWCRLYVIVTLLTCSCGFLLLAFKALRLWELVVEDAELPSHLEALRRYFLMGRVRGGLW